MKRKKKRIIELWYARVLGFQGDHTVTDQDALNAEDYKDSAVEVTIYWFYQAKEARKELSSTPGSDALDHLHAALTVDQHLAGAVEDTIEWETIIRSSTRGSFHQLLI